MDSLEPRVQEILMQLDQVLHDRDVPTDRKRQVWEIMKSLIDIRDGVAKLEKVVNIVEDGYYAAQSISYKH